MSSSKPLFNSKQRLFKEIVAGTLIYAVVLGFFDDYTSIFYAKSFSTIFLVAVVMQILTLLTFKLKDQALMWLKGRHGTMYTLARFFCVWLIMFLSKFVFLWVIDMFFGSTITISGFIGLLAIIISVTILSKLADYTFFKLGDT